MSNRHRRDGMVETPVGTGGVWADDIDGMLGYIGREHLYAERVVDVTPAAVEGLFNQRVWKDGTAVWDGVNVAASVLLGKVEPGTFWLVEHLNVYGALATDLGFAYLMEGIGVTNYTRRARVQMDAGGAYVAFGQPVFIGGGDVIVRAVQTAAAASSVIVTAQVRIIGKS